MDDDDFEITNPDDTAKDDHTDFKVFWMISFNIWMSWCKEVKADYET